MDVDGYYVQFGWIITGENRPYKAGAFKRVKPASPKGRGRSLPVLKRVTEKYSDVGLATIDGEQTTLVPNYYANKNVRLSVS